mmetsp:Transcript_27441/g.72227  ORF Transcript_27441/g.72227 Transcript_27441/m.72227 type:complete len:244 (-) Transcript_27441:269-1000(-)
MSKRTTQRHRLILLMSCPPSRVASSRAPTGGDLARESVGCNRWSGSRLLTLLALIQEVQVHNLVKYLVTRRVTGGLHLHEDVARSGQILGFEACLHQQLESLRRNGDPKLNELGMKVLRHEGATLHETKSTVEYHLRFVVRTRRCVGLRVQKTLRQTRRRWWWCDLGQKHPLLPPLERDKIQQTLHVHLDLGSIAARCLVQRWLALRVAWPSPRTRVAPSSLAPTVTFAFLKPLCPLLLNLSD